MPLTEKGEKILGAMEEQYGSEKKAKQVLYASKNKGTITGIDATTFAQSFPATDEGAFVTGQLEKPESTDQVIPAVASFVGREAASSAIGYAAKPFGFEATPTQSQAQENVALGRSPTAGAFSAQPGPMSDVNSKQLGFLTQRAGEGKLGYSQTSGGQDLKKALEAEAAKGKGKDAEAAKPTSAWKSLGAKYEEMAKTGKPPKDAAGRPPDKRIGTLRDYAIAAGAKKR